MISAADVVSTLKRYSPILLSAAVVAALECAGFYMVTWVRFLQGDLRGLDFISFYVAGRIFDSPAAGPSVVYNESIQRQFQDQLTTLMWNEHYRLLPFVHPPWFTPIMGLLTQLPYRSAYLVWALIGVACAACALWLLLRASPGIKQIVGLALFVGYLPLFVTLLQGQSDALLLLPLCASYAAWVRGHRTLAGALAGLAILKPQLLLLIPALFIARRAWGAISAMVLVAGTYLILAILISAQSLWQYIQLVSAWAVGAAQLPFGQHAWYSLRGLLEVTPGGRPLALLILGGLLLLVALSLSWQPDAPRLDMALALAGSVLLSPFQNVEDLLLLIVPGFALAQLMTEGSIRWRGTGIVILFLGYVSINLALFLGPLPVDIVSMALVLFLAAERLNISQPAIPRPSSGVATPRPRRIAVLPAYKASRTLKEVVEGIPAGSIDRILLVDDASADSTVSVAQALRLDVIRHPRNLGYGGNQKTCYLEALSMGADVVVMLHPDNQYNPAIIPELCQAIEIGGADLVLGSRWLGLDPGSTGMPWWKRLGNRFLTWAENRVLGLNLSEYHTGYRAYSRHFLEVVPFLENSNDFVFDTQILIQAAAFGFRIKEVQAVGRYFEEASSIGFWTSVVYGTKTLMAAGRYVLHRAGFSSRWLNPQTDAILSVEPAS